MSDPFLGEIKIFAGNFAPRGWAECAGQLLAVSQNDALFSLFGTTYGGDGRTSFGLPDMRGRVPVSFGQGPGLTSRPIGQRSGQENVTLTSNQIPQHNHEAHLQAVALPATSVDPINNHFAISAGGNAYHSGTGRGSSPVAMHPNALASVGGNQQHNNMAPSIALYFIVSLVGIYPSRS